MQELLSSLGPVCAVIGAQWGDEGKGKLIDVLAEHFDVIARACGGANAGHTIMVDGKKHVFRLLPSGSLHADKQIVLGSGMVLHLPTLLEEISILKEAGIDVIPRLHISASAHIVFDFHKDVDAALEEGRAMREGQGIGTTRKGIGPTYMDKAARRSVRLEHLRDNSRKEFDALAAVTEDLYSITIDREKEWKQIQKAREIIGKCIEDTSVILSRHLHEKRVLIEGAQATLLDIDHGTYPYVTSSSTTLAGALQGLGMAPRKVTSCIGVAKAYCTRVGSGEFMTEVSGERGDKLRERGGEYGSVTGRPRRCGWLSIPDLQYAALINGFDCWNITKMDVLDAEENIPVAVDVKNGEPVYEELPGWKTSTQGITSFDKLPAAAQKFLKFIEAQTKIPTQFIGTGREREAMVIKK